MKGGREGAEGEGYVSVGGGGGGVAGLIKEFFVSL